MKGELITLEKACSYLNDGGWTLAGGWLEKGRRNPRRIYKASIDGAILTLKTAAGTEMFNAADLTARLQVGSEPFEIRLDGPIWQRNGLDHCRTPWTTSHLMFVNPGAKKRHDAAVLAAKLAAEKAAKEEAARREHERRQQIIDDRNAATDHFLARQLSISDDGRIKKMSASENGLEIEFENGTVLLIGARATWGGDVTLHLMSGDSDHLHPIRKMLI